MKKAGLLAWFLCIISTSIIAQTTELDYRPFAEEGKMWEIRVGPIKENIYRSRIDGDTMINGNSWKKIYNYNGFLIKESSYHAAIRDVGKKVYIIAKGSTKPRLLYDFGLKEGDVVRCGAEGNNFACLLDKDEKPDTILGFPLISYLKLERIEIITYNNQQYRRFILSILDSFEEPLLELNLMSEDKVNHENVVWVEGVGSGAGLFFPWLLLPPQSILFQKCYINEESFFAYPGFYMSGEPAAIGNTIYNRSESNVMHNLQGISQSSAPQKGIYIQNGKKVVIK